MEYKQIKKLLDNTSNEPSNFRTRNRFEINYESRGTYSTISQIKFKSNLCNYSDAYIHNNSIRGSRCRHKYCQRKVTFENCASFTDCINGINNRQVDHARHFDVVMPIYNLIEYSDIYSKTSWTLWQYYSDKP